MQRREERAPRQKQHPDPLSLGKCLRPETPPLKKLVGMPCTETNTRRIPPINRQEETHQGADSQWKLILPKNKTKIRSWNVRTLQCIFENNRIKIKMRFSNNNYYFVPSITIPKFPQLHPTKKRMLCGIMLF